MKTLLAIAISTTILSGCAHIAQNIQDMIVPPPSPPVIDSFNEYAPAGSYYSKAAYCGRMAREARAIAELRDTGTPQADIDGTKGNASPDPYIQRMVFEVYGVFLKTSAADIGAIEQRQCLRDA